MRPVKLCLLSASLGLGAFIPLRPGTGADETKEKASLSRGDSVAHPPKMHPLSARQAPDGAPNWSGKIPPISDQEFCTLSRAMGWVAYGLMNETRALSPVTTQGKPKYDYPGYGTQVVMNSDPKVVIIGKMLQVWEKLMVSFERQLKWTPTMKNQMRCSACYVEYCKSATDWLVMMRRRAPSYSYDNEVVVIFLRRLKGLVEAHQKVSKFLVDGPWSPINQEIPAVDETGWSLRLQHFYNVLPKQSLKSFIHDADPVTRYPGGGAFKEAIEAWERGDGKHLKKYKSQKRSLNANQVTGPPVRESQLNLINNLLLKVKLFAQAHQPYAAPVAKADGAEESSQEKGQQGNPNREEGKGDKATDKKKVEGSTAESKKADVGDGKPKPAAVVDSEKHGPGAEAEEKRVGGSPSGLESKSAGKAIRRRGLIPGGRASAKGWGYLVEGDLTAGQDYRRAGHILKGE
ncbi:hypothetical protein CDD83_400 [Cordyceps sp. RAO-2017]|nr:hypothetical protein CDD83_400 [Cordyceps sp. RAO-2017]